MSMSISNPVPSIAPSEARSFIDFEASGFGGKSYPIEVGLVLPDGQTYCSLISPEPDWKHWDDAAQKVHGVDRSILETYGKPAAEVASHINTLLQGQTVYTDAWYHDYNWLSRLFDAAESRPSFKLEDLRQLLDEAHLARWDAAKAQILQEMNITRHRASNDAKVLQQTLLRVLQLAAKDQTLDRA